MKTLQRMACLLLAVLPFTVLAQTAVPPKGGVDAAGNGTPPGSNNKSPQALLSEAKTLVRGNNVSAAEAKLAEGNITVVDSAAWHLETSQKLIRVADDLSCEGTKAPVSAVVAQALKRLEAAGDAARRRNDVGAQASAKSLVGFLQERYQGDVSGAIASYRSVVQLEPENKAAQEALDRLQRSQAILEARFRVNRGR